jgi:Zn-finger nucleic acid-binding protein
MNCPRCRGPLVAVERERIELDWCPACQGLWFDAGEIELLTERLGITLPQRETPPFAAAEVPEPARACPRCDRRMGKVWFDAGRTVLVDRCRHGLWFDQGELGQAIESLRSGAPGAPGTIIKFLGEAFRR